MTHFPNSFLDKDLNLYSVGYFVKHKNGKEYGIVNKEDIKQKQSFNKCRQTSRMSQKETDAHSGLLR